MAAADVTASVDALRAGTDVDPGRRALWLFSGGGLLAALWLRRPPGWLRCVAMTYPILAVPLGTPVDAAFPAGRGGDGGR